MNATTTYIDEDKTDFMDSSSSSKTHSASNTNNQSQEPGCTRASEIERVRASPYTPEPARNRRDLPRLHTVTASLRGDQSIGSRSSYCYMQPSDDGQVAGSARPPVSRERRDSESRLGATLHVCRSPRQFACLIIYRAGPPIIRPWDRSVR